MRLIRTPFLVALIVVAACGDSNGAVQEQQPVTKSPPVAREAFESTGGGFSIDFPGTWHDGFTTLEHADTTDGARYVVEFMFKPDPSIKVEPRRLLAVRIFTQAAWAKVLARSGPPVAKKVAEKGDDVFTYSVPGGNPYKPGTAAAARFDELVLSVVEDLKLTVK
jgi:hypothetical protein